MVLANFDVIKINYEAKYSFFLFFCYVYGDISLFAFSLKFSAKSNFRLVETSEFRRKKTNDVPVALPLQPLFSFSLYKCIFRVVFDTFHLKCLKVIPKISDMVSIFRNGSPEKDRARSR